MASRRFYGARKSSSSSAHPRPNKKTRLSDLAEAIRISHDVTEDLTLGDIGDLSDIDDAPTNGDCDQIEKSGQAGEREDDLSFNSSHSSGMYTFDPLTSSPLSVTRPHSSASNSGSSLSRSSDHLVDLIQRQSHLIMELLNKHDGLTDAIEEVKQDLKEARSHVDKLMEVQQNKVPDASKKQKRKYPNSLTV